MSMRELQGLPMIDKQMVKELLEARDDLQDIIDAQEQYEKDPMACQSIDRKKGRGILVVNPDVEFLSEAHGNICVNDGVEYRVTKSEAMRGMVNSDGRKVYAFWVPPLIAYPPFTCLIPFKLDERMKPNEFRIKSKIDPKLCDRCGEENTRFTVRPHGIAVCVDCDEKEHHGMATKTEEQD